MADERLTNPEWKAVWPDAVDRDARRRIVGAVLRGRRLAKPAEAGLAMELARRSWWVSALLGVMVAASALQMALTIGLGDVATRLRLVSVIAGAVGGLLLVAHELGRRRALRRNAEHADLRSWRRAARRR